MLYSVLAARHVEPFSNHIFDKYYKHLTTFSNGCLGFSNDEGRRKMR